MGFEFFNIYTTSLILLVFLALNYKKIKSEIIINNSEQNTTSRFYFFDFLKGISIIGVVMMHVAYFYITFNSNISWIASSDFIVKILRFAVPFFIISSGFLLSLKDFSKNSLLAFYKSKFIRLVVPYFIFCLIIFLFDNNFNLVNFFNGLLLGNISVPYYFMIILLQLYLVYPLILMLISKFGGFRVLISSFIISFISFIFAYKIGEFSLFLPYLFFFVFGIFIRKYLLNSNIVDVLKKRGFLKISYVILFVYFLCAIAGKFDEYSNFQFAYSIVLFFVMFAIKEKIEGLKIYKYIVTLGKNSLWVFLSHFFIMEIIFSLIKNKLDFRIEFILFTFLSIIFGLVLPTLISILIQKSLALRKI